MRPMLQVGNGQKCRRRGQGRGIELSGRLIEKTGRTRGRIGENGRGYQCCGIRASAADAHENRETFDRQADQETDRREGEGRRTQYFVPPPADRLGEYVGGLDVGHEQLDGYV